MEGLVGVADPFTSIQDALRDGHFDQVILSTLPRKTSKSSRSVTGRAGGRRAGWAFRSTSIAPRTCRIWVDYDLKSAEVAAARVAERASPAYDSEGVKEKTSSAPWSSWVTSRSPSRTARRT